MPRCVPSPVHLVEHGSRCTQLARRSFSRSRALGEQYRVADLFKSEDAIQDVEIYGRIRSLRKQKRIAFVTLEDGSTTRTIQAVLTPEQTEGLSFGTAIRLHGSWISSSGKDQAYELKASSIEACGQNDAESNPIQPKYQSLEFLRTVPHLRARMTGNAHLLRLRSAVMASITSWFHEQHFVQCHTPVITSSDCEGAGEVFSVLSGEQMNDREVGPFFNAPKYLTVSAQLHLEALAQAVDKVWTLSPTFRAEKSDTPRHLSEFYMLEAELCYVQNVDQVMDVVENMLRAMATSLKDSEVVQLLLDHKRDREGTEDEHAVSAEEVAARWQGLASSRWPRVTYDDAIELLKGIHEDGRHQFSIAPSYDNGLAAEHERYLANAYGSGSPVFITNYPAEQKPFYMLPDENSEAGKEKVCCFDLLVPDLCELVGGSMREHRLEHLQVAMKAKGVSGASLDWYSDLRRYGSAMHGGFGLGFDRLISYLAGMSSVRDVVSFPRYYGRADC